MKNLIIMSFFALLISYNLHASQIVTEYNIEETSGYINCGEEFEEYETLSYKASLVKFATTQQDITRLAKEATLTCYNAYKSSFEQQVRQGLERFIALGAANGSGAKLVPIRIAKTFAETIINQISSLTQQLIHNDKQLFFTFCSVNGSKAR